MSPQDPLSRDELRRYSRQLLLPELAQGQQRLKAARVLLVGLGGLGSPLLGYLAGAGVGALRLSDPDRVGLSNLHRQTLYSSADLGRPKAGLAAARAQLQNPHVRVETAPALSAENAAELLEGVTLAVDATDNFETRHALSDACAAAGVPLVWGAAAGTEGMVSVFAGGRRLRDLFPTPEGAEDCATAGVFGPLVGVVGAQMAAEALKLLTGVGEPLTGRLWLYDALSGRVRLLSLPA